MARRSTSVACYLLLIAVLGIPCQAQAQGAQSQKLPDITTDRQVDMCVQLLYNELHSDRAKIVLQSATRRELRSILGSALQQRPRGSKERAAIAFALAYYGIDEPQNVDQILLYYSRLAVDTLDDDSSAWRHAIIQALYRLIERHKSQEVATRLLRLRGNGWPLTTLIGTRINLVLEYPQLAFVAIGKTPGSAKRLAEEIMQSRNEKVLSAVRGVTRQFAGNKDSQVRTAALELLDNLTAQGTDSDAGRR